MERKEGKKTRPSIRDFFTNLSGPMPLSEKITLLIRNNVIKMTKQKDCCGHPGEPGVDRPRRTHPEGEEGKQ